MLSPEQLAARENKITASFLPALMAGNEQVILSKWRELIGDPTWVRDDLTDDWLPSFGSYVEPFALDWHQRKTGKALTRRGEVVTHPTRPYVAATLDAWREADNTVIDCKTINAHRALDDVVSYYVPQLICQRACVGADKAALLIVHGGTEPQEITVDLGHSKLDAQPSDAEIAAAGQLPGDAHHRVAGGGTPSANDLGHDAVDAQSNHAEIAAAGHRVFDAQAPNAGGGTLSDYEALVWLRVEQFHHCVETLTPPVPLPTVVPPERWRSLDLDNVDPRPNWAGDMDELLAAWKHTVGPASEFEATKVAIKGLLPPDIGKLYSAGLVVARDRRNAVSIRYRKATS